MIREATEKDLVEILEIYNDAIVNTTSVYHYTPQTLEDRIRWFQKKKQNNLPIIVFEQGERIVGFGTYGPFREWDAYKYTIEHSIYVGSGSKGSGIGSLLLKELIQLASASEYKLMVAGIDDQNKASIYLHEKFGFTYSGTINKAGYKFDKWLNLVFYQLELPGPKTPTE